MEENSHIIGCFVSSHASLRNHLRVMENSPSDKGEIFRQYIWGKFGLCVLLKKLKREDYGSDLKLILFQFYVNPISYLLQNLKEIEKFRKNEGAIGIPVIVTDENFFTRSEKERVWFLKRSIIEKLDFLDAVVKRNKLDTNLKLLKSDVEKTLS